MRFLSSIALTPKHRGRKCHEHRGAGAQENVGPAPTSPSPLQPLLSRSPDHQPSPGLLMLCRPPWSAELSRSSVGGKERCPWSWFVSWPGPWGWHCGAVLPSAASGFQPPSTRYRLAEAELAETNDAVSPRPGLAVCQQASCDLRGSSVLLPPCPATQTGLSGAAGSRAGTRAGRDAAGGFGSPPVHGSSFSSLHHYWKLHLLMNN